MSSESARSAREALGEVTARRDAAQRRVDELEAEQRAAGQARAAARAALVEAERTGARPAERSRAGKALADADLKPTILTAKMEGARAAVRDAEVEVARVVGANLDELVAAREEDGRTAVASLNAALQEVVAAFHRREAIAAEISGLASMAGRIHPGDVSRSRAEEVVRAVSDLLANGGELAPTLDRDPRLPRLGAPTEAAA
jgi:hypothetical protein